MADDFHTLPHRTKNNTHYVNERCFLDELISYVSIYVSFYFVLNTYSLNF